MPIQTVEHSGKKYPFFQTTGNASRFIIPFAQEFCKGVGFDVGYCKEEWKFPGAIGVDPSVNSEFDADHLPPTPENVDYIFSSHCLEHVENWVDTLLYWLTRIKKGGILFLYLPDYSQTYWRPWFNRKHRNVMIPEVIADLLKSKGCQNIFVSGVDLNNSFTLVCEV